MVDAHRDQLDDAELARRMLSMPTEDADPQVAAALGRMRRRAVAYLGQHRVGQQGRAPAPRPVALHREPRSRPARAVVGVAQVAVAGDVADGDPGGDDDEAALGVEGVA